MPLPRIPVMPAPHVPQLPPPQAPHALPPARTPSQPVSPDGVLAPTPDRAEIPLPNEERKVAIDPVTLSLKRLAGSWQLWADRVFLRDFGNSEMEARDALRVIRELRVNEWVAIGGPRPVVEYGLRNGRATVAAGIAKFALPIDLASARAEYVKGVWVLRDEENLLFNFGTNRADAEQAVAVVRKYGFDRVGFVGQPAPAMAYFFAAPPGEQPPKIGLGALGRQMQVDSLLRTGIPVPGLGFVGEMIKIDYRKVEARRDGHEWVLAHGSDVIAKFGAGEWQARDALKVVQDGRFTEWCRFGSPGVSFFLAGGKAPTRVPFATQGRPFSLTDLHVRQFNDKWFVTEGGRPLYEVSTFAEGDDLIRILRAYGFDRVCHSGNSPRASLTFLAKSR